MASIEIHDALKQALEREVAESPCWFPVTIEQLVTWAILDQLMECWLERLESNDAHGLYKQLKRGMGEGDDVDYWEGVYRQP